MKILILYFSATGNTANIAKIIEEKFTEAGAEVNIINITSNTDRERRIDFQPYQAVVFGAPIHSSLAPRPVREWLRTLDGHGKKCAMFFTYGGFGVHPAHFSTRQILREQNFIVVSSAEFLGAHTFNLGGWRAMRGRPDPSDYDLAGEYAVRMYHRFSGEDAGIMGVLPESEYTDEQLDQRAESKFNIVTKIPTRDGEECRLCMRCEQLCPTGAMNAERGQAEAGKCIACFACVANCPDHALRVNDLSESWLPMLEKKKTDEEELKRQKSKIYL